MFLSNEKINLKVIILRLLSPGKKGWYHKMLKWPNFNYYKTVTIRISLKRPRSLIFHFASVEFSTQDFLSRGAAEIYLYPISSCPDSKVGYRSPL